MARKAKPVEEKCGTCKFFGHPDCKDKKKTSSACADHKKGESQFTKKKNAAKAALARVGKQDLPVKQDPAPVKQDPAPVQAPMPIDHTIITTMDIHELHAFTTKASKVALANKDLVIAKMEYEFEFERNAKLKQLRAVMNVKSKQAANHRNEYSTFLATLADKYNVKLTEITIDDETGVIRSVAHLDANNETHTD